MGTTSTCRSQRRRSVDVDEGQQSRYGLINVSQAKRAFVTIVVRRIDAFSDSLYAGDSFDRTSILGRNSRTNDAGEGSMIALDAHDASSGYPKLRSAEIPHAYQIGRDECVFQRDERIQCGLSIGKHVDRDRKTT